MWLLIACLATVAFFSLMQVRYYTMRARYCDAMARMWFLIGEASSTDLSNLDEAARLTGLMFDESARQVSDRLIAPPKPDTTSSRDRPI